MGRQQVLMNYKKQQGGDASTFHWLSEQLLSVGGSRLKSRRRSVIATVERCRDVRGRDAIERGKGSCVAGVWSPLR
jgi:hypothetical protein